MAYRRQQPQPKWGQPLELDRWAGRRMAGEELGYPADLLESMSLAANAAAAFESKLQPTGPAAKLGQQVPSERLSLAMLTAYLNSVYPGQALAWPQTGALARPQAQPGERVERAQQEGANSSLLLHGAAVLLAILGVCVAVKLVTSKGGLKFRGRRLARDGSLKSLWSSADESTESSAVLGPPSKHADLKCASLTRRASHDSGLSTTAEETEKRSLDLLAQKLVSLVCRGQNQSSEQSSNKGTSIEVSCGANFKP